MALDPASGETKWSHFDRNFPYLSSPAVSDQLVIFGACDRVMRALERDTGELGGLFRPAPRSTARP